MTCIVSEASGPVGRLKDKTIVAEQSLMVFLPLDWMPLKVISLLRF
jgi:hypothetical protein